MKVLIYEDNKEDLQRLIDCLTVFTNNKKIKCDVMVCNKATQLYEHANDYDLAFLDVEGLDGSGIDIGINVRKMNADIKIIFITNYSKYLIDGYKASANRFFLKPIEQDIFNIELENVVNDYLINNMGFTDLDIYPKKIYFKDILYVEFVDRKTSLHMINGEVIITPYTLKYWIERLSNYFFAQPYKPYLVNLRQIKQVTKTEVIMTNDEVISLSRMFKNDFEQKYYESLKRRI